jgi:hypothetical protein
MIIKAIVRQKVDVSRVGYRDALSYFSILLDDNNRKAICRLYLNGHKKHIALFDDHKKEIKHEIFNLDDLFKYSDQLIKTIESYLKLKEVES